MDTLNSRDYQKEKDTLMAYIRVLENELIVASNQVNTFIFKLKDDLTEAIEAVSNEYKEYSLGPIQTKSQDID